MREFFRRSSFNSSVVLWKETFIENIVQLLSDEVYGPLHYTDKINRKY